MSRTPSPTSRGRCSRATEEPTYAPSLSLSTPSDMCPLLTVPEEGVEESRPKRTACDQAMPAQKGLSSHAEVFPTELKQKLDLYQDITQESPLV